MTTEAVRLSVADKNSSATLSIQQISKSKRIGKAIIVGSIGLIISLALVFIPILHFVLVPFGLLITLLLVINRLKTDQIIIDGVGVCPACEAHLQIYKRAYKLPFKDVCEKCSREVQVLKS